MLIFFCHVVEYPDENTSASGHHWETQTGGRLWFCGRNDIHLYEGEDVFAAAWVLGLIEWNLVLISADAGIGFEDTVKKKTFVIV